VQSSAPSYVFGDAESDREFSRLQQIESALDPASKRLLQRASPVLGWSCLEVGAGAGSIANWLADAVGPTGSVLALDANPRFLTRGSRRNVDIIRQDIRDWEGKGAYDLVHARYVLIHIPESELAIERMVASLRPGGWIVLEEPDFLAARFAGGAADFADTFHHVNAAIKAMFESRGMDPALGTRVPAALNKLGLTVVDVESEAHLVAGGSEIALMMRASTEQLRDKYVATGLASDADIEGYLRFARDPNAWGIYYATVRVVARR
jgi:2-polyprenyl-3-methyl-5-hydroxy-6-metoxy-1,4-benzoquinol methylase